MMVTVAILLIAAALAGLFIWWRNTDIQKAERAADDIRASGGTLGDQVGGGPSIDGALTAFGDVITNGFGAPQKRAETRIRALNADVENKLLERIANGEYFFQEVTVPAGISLEGSRRAVVMVKRRRRNPSLSAALSIAVQDSWAPNGINILASWDSGHSPDLWLEADAFPLTVRSLYDEGDLWSFTDDMHYKLVWKSSPDIAGPDSRKLYQAILRKYPGMTPVSSFAPSPGGAAPTPAAPGTAQSVPSTGGIRVYRPGEVR